MNLYDMVSAEDQNYERATWAAEALRAFGEMTGQEEYFDGPVHIESDLFQEIAGDLIGNLFHLARLNGVEPGVITDAAYLHFEAEVMEEESEEGQEEQEIEKTPARI